MIKNPANLGRIFCCPSWMDIFQKYVANIVKWMYNIFILAYKEE